MNPGQCNAGLFLLWNNMIKTFWEWIMGIFRGRGTVKTGHGNAQPTGGIFRPTIGGAPQLSVPSVLTNGKVGTAYSYPFQVTGIVLDWAVVTPSASGEVYGLPPGLSVSNAGVLNGVPTTAGQWSFTIRAHNNLGFAYKTVIIKIDPADTVTLPPTTPAAPVITTNTLSAGTQNTAYTATLAVTGVVDTYTWTGLPTGITASGGTISGTPTVYGTFVVTAMATNTGGNSPVKTYNLVLTQAVTVTAPDTAVVRTHGPASVAFNTAHTCTLTISPKPAEGNTLVIVLSDIFAGNVTVTDNQSASNVYTVENQASIDHPADETVKIIYCQNIIIGNPGSDYIITVYGDAFDPSFVFSAIEVSGVVNGSPVRAFGKGGTATNNTAYTLTASGPSTPEAGDLAVYVVQNSYPSGATGLGNAPGYTSINTQADATLYPTHQSGYKVLTAGGTVTATPTVTLSEDMFGILMVFAKGGTVSVPVTPNPSDVLTTELLISMATQPNVVQPSGSSGPYNAPLVGFDSEYGQPNDVKGPFVTASFSPSQGWTKLVPWGLIANLPGGPTGAIDKLWIAVKNLQLWQHSPARGWERKAFLVAPGHDIYRNDQALNTPAPTYQLNPTDDGARMRVSDLSLNAIWSGHAGVWHFYDYSGADLDADADFVVTCYQTRIEGDTISDRDTQFPNSKLCAYASGDLTSPGVNYTEIGHSKYVPLTTSWQWVGFPAGKTASPADVTPVPNTYYNYFRSIGFPSVEPQLLVTQDDPRVMWWVDPKLSFANQPSPVYQHMFSGPPWPALQTQSEAGLNDPTTGTLAFKRVPNPQNAADVSEANKVFLMRSGGSFSTFSTSGLHKTELLPAGSTLGVDYDTSRTVWIAFAVMPGPDLVPSNSGTNVFDMHNSETTIVAYSAVNMAADSGGQIYLNLSSKTAPSGVSDRITETVWSDTHNGADMFYIVIQCKLGHDVATHPFFKMWVAKNSGALTQVVNKIDYPIGYSDNGVFYYQKFGAYTFNGAGVTATNYFIGFFMLNDLPTPFALNENLMLSLIR